MTRSGVKVDEVIAAPGVTPGQAHDRLLAAIEADEGYQAVQVGPDRFHFARTFRPMWAIVAAAITVWFVLIGIAFLFVKSTETCLAVVESDHRGTRVRLQGRISSAALGRIRASLSPDGPGAHPQTPAGEASFGAACVPVGSPVAFTGVAAPESGVLRPAGVPAPGFVERSPFVADQPAAPTIPPGIAAAAQVHLPVIGAETSTPGAPDGIDGRTVAKPRVLDGSPGCPRAVLDDGSVVDLGELTLIGRDPVGAAGEQAQLVAIEDPTRSVSKTHLGIICEGTAWSVMDRNSTNGSCVVLSDGTLNRLDAGVPVPIGDGVEVRFGDRRLHLDLRSEVSR